METIECAQCKSVMGVLRKTPRWALYKCFSCRRVVGRIDDQLEPRGRENATRELDRYAGLIVSDQRRNISREDLAEAVAWGGDADQRLASSCRPLSARSEHAGQQSEPDDSARELGLRNARQLCQQAVELYDQSDGYGFAEASALYRKALETYQQLADQDGVVECLYEIGRMAEDRGNYAKAARLYAESLAICERWPSPRADRIQQCIRAGLL